MKSKTIKSGSLYIFLFSGTVTPLPIVVSTRASVSFSTPATSSIVVSSQPDILLPDVQAGLAPSTTPLSSPDISHSHGSSGFKVTVFMTFFEFVCYVYMSVIIVPFIDLLNLKL